MPAKAIFQNSSQQLLFEKQGFLVLENFLNADEVKHMDELFDQLHPNLPESGFYAGSYSNDFAYKKQVSEEIKRVYHRAYEEHFKDYTPFGGAYLLKMPTADSDLFIHQDWTVVDESKDIALNVWVPLCDITIENGPLMVLPGSHYDNLPTLRAPTMRYFFDQDYERALRQLEPIIVKAGTAVVLNQSLVHYSPPNTSGKIRKAITAGIKSKDAQMIFHFKDPEKNENKLEKFLMDDDFFIHFENFFEDIYKRPIVGESIGFIDYTPQSITGKELEKTLEKMKTSAGFSYKVFEEPKENQPPIEKENNTATKTPPFWEVYTPLNILREIKLRLRGK
jgi:ectoine hydroxylase-related dioxygenase (phytanoyl-CoA dioxygenase family)